jgi:hypothetical protein
MSWYYLVRTLAPLVLLILFPENLFVTKAKYTSIKFIVVRNRGEQSVSQLLKDYKPPVLHNDTDKNVIVFRSALLIDHHNGTKDSPKTVYLVKNNKASIFPDWTTVFNCGADSSDIDEIDEVEFAHFSFTRISKLPPLHVSLYAKTVHEVFKRESYKSHHLQGIKLIMIDTLGDYCNPSITFVNNHMLLASRPTYRDVEGRETILFRWYNSPHYRHNQTFQNYYYDRSRTQSSSSINDLSHGVSNYLGVQDVDLGHLAGRYADITPGEDPRFLQVNDTLSYIFYTVPPHDDDTYTIGMSILEINASSKNLELTVKHDSVSWTPAGLPQKNWGPFFLPADNNKTERDVYIVEWINPLSIIKLNYSDIHNNKKNYINFTRVSTATEEKIEWGYGGLRGGTPPIYIPGYNLFLAFFHSQNHFTKWHRSYIFGAYTFTTSPPFRLISYTTFPIWYDPFYKGELHIKEKSWRVDYVAFPTSAWLNLNSEGKFEVIVTIGNQDERGYLVKFDLKELIENLTKV